MEVGILIDADDQAAVIDGDHDTDIRVYLGSVGRGGANAVLLGHLTALHDLTNVLIPVAPHRTFHGRHDLHVRQDSQRNFGPPVSGQHRVRSDKRPDPITVARFQSVEEMAAHSGGFSRQEIVPSSSSQW